jgi:ferric-dicitrate binding protein FerR (iron transport regulator)
MPKPDSWNLFERLADPATSPAQRRELESLLARDPRLREGWETFQLLQDWADLEAAAAPAAGLRFERLEAAFEEAAMDEEMVRWFPWVAVTALAAALILAAINLGTDQQLAAGPLEALFGLPQPSLEETLLADL